MKKMKYILIVVSILIGTCGFVYLESKNIPTASNQSIYPIMVHLEDVKSEYVLLEEIESGRVIVDKKASELLYPASMTKMMSALVVIESVDDLEEKIVVPESIFPYLWKEEASVAGFRANEEVSILDLLYGVLLPSGADCTLTLAYYIAGSEMAFADMMNDKAKEIGMENTHFVNSSGLHDENQVTTAFDLMKLVRYALKNETFKEIYSTKEHITENGIRLKSSMFSALGSEKVNDGEILGGKTGYTGEAGRCLASYANVNGIEYILITAKAGKEFTAHVNDAKVIYNQISTTRLYDLKTSDHVLNEFKIVRNFK